MNILDVSPYGVYPPKSGGSTRIYSLNYELARQNNVTLFSQGIRKFELKYPLRSWITNISGNFEEYRFVSKFSLSVTYLSDLIQIHPMFSGNVLSLLSPKVLTNLMEKNDIIQVEHPWQFEYIYKFKPDNIPLVLCEHNVEFDLLSQYRKSSLLSKKMREICKKKEKYAIENADAIFTTSQDDINRLADFCNISKNKFYVIPNGVNISKFNLSTEEEKSKIKKMMNLDGKKVVLFAGSKYIPNIEAVYAIQRISDKVENKEIVFLVAGRVGESFTSRENLHFTGYVDNISNYFKMADLAINPMISGSGTNLKVLEYLASGIPTITTEIGARGLNIENGKHAIISKIEDFPKWINILFENPDLYTKLQIDGRKLMENKYDWKQIAKKQFTIYEKLLKH